jgi:hypothetical protein
MIYLLWPAVMASVMIAVWLVRHPAALLSVNVVAATGIAFGATAALLVALTPWTAWWMRGGLRRS